MSPSRGAHRVRNAGIGIATEIATVGLGLLLRLPNTGLCKGRRVSGQPLRFCRRWQLRRRLAGNKTRNLRAASLKEAKSNPC